MIIGKELEDALLMPLSGTRWKAYPQYKDSHIGWLEEIPNHWEVKKLRYLSVDSLTNGLFKKKEHFGTGTKIINVVDIYQENLQINLKNVDLVEITQSEFDTYEVLSGDIFFVRSSLKLEGVGASACAVKISEPVVFECHLVRLRPDPKQIIPLYLTSYLNSVLVHQRLIALAQTTTMTTISQYGLASLKTLIPPIPEQIAIASFIDRETAKIDALIIKKEQLIRLLQEKRAALISQAVTRGLDPDVQMKDSGIEWLGEIPAHWEIKKVKYSCVVFGGGTPSKENREYWIGDIPWVSPKDMKADTISDTEEHITEEAVHNSATRIIPPGAVLVVVRSGILKHSIPIAVNAVPAAINQDMKAIVPKVFLSSRYLADLISGYQKALLVQWRKQGATVESIELELLVNTTIPIPPLSEQQAIIRLLDKEVTKLDKLISTIHEGIKKLQEYRTAMISAAVTGKIDVRDEQTNWHEVEAVSD